RVTYNAPFRAGKGFLYEGGLRVPLIVQGPGILRKRVVDAPFLATDWMPTLPELPGVAAPPNLGGLSQAAGPRTGRAGDGTRDWHIPQDTNQGSRPSGAVRDGRWKLIERYDDGKVELFDLQDDPGETRDVSAAHASIARALGDKLRAWRTSVGAQENTP